MSTRGSLQLSRFALGKNGVGRVVEVTDRLGLRHQFKQQFKALSSHCFGQKESHTQEAAALRDFNPAYVACGSTADFKRSISHVRFTPSKPTSRVRHNMSASCHKQTLPRGQLYIRFSTSGSSALAAAMSASPPVASPFLRLARPRPYNALASLGSSLMALLKSATASTLSPVLK